MPSRLVAGCGSRRRKCCRWRPSRGPSALQVNLFDVCPISMYANDTTPQAASWSAPTTTRSTARRAGHAPSCSPRRLTSSTLPCGMRRPPAGGGVRIWICSSACRRAEPLQQSSSEAECAGPAPATPPASTTCATRRRHTPPSSPSRTLMSTCSFTPTSACCRWCLWLSSTSTITPTADAC